MHKWEQKDKATITPFLKLRKIMDKLFIRLEFKGAATVQNCQEVLDLIRQHTMVKSVEFVINGQGKIEVMEKKEKEVEDALL